MYIYVYNPPIYLETQPSNLHVQPAPRSLLPFAVVSGHFKATPSRTPHSQVSGRSTHGSLGLSASPHLQIGFTNVRLLTDFFVSLGRVFSTRYMCHLLVPDYTEYQNPLRDWFLVLGLY